MSTLEIPRTLPVANLSVSSVSTFLRCPEKWRRRYLEREYEPPSAAMILGSSVGAAEGAAYQHQIDTGQRLATPDVLDLFSDEFEDRVGREEVVWDGHTPAEIKDTGVSAVKAYDTTLAPSVTPISVEREFQLHFEGVDWGLLGYFDLEDQDGHVIDLKVRGRKLSDADARADIQPTAYLLARRAEGNPAPAFHYHTMVKTKTPYAESVPTVRTDRQLDAFTDRLLNIAAEIQWRLEYDVWAGAVPGSWWCSQRSCGHWSSCPMGGAR